VSFFFKQIGEWAPCPPEDWHGMGPQGTPPQLAVGPNGETAGGFIGKGVAAEREREGWRPVVFVGKREAGHLLDGKAYTEFPVPAKPLPTKGVRAAGHVVAGVREHVEADAL
jgi:hypothetical protein